MPLMPGTQQPPPPDNAALKEQFHRLFGPGRGTERVHVVRAPGRVNLIGEHTDYNDGFVLPLALEFGVAAAARVAEQPVLRVRSAQKGETIELPLAAIAPGAVDGWSAYVSGV